MVRPSRRSLPSPGNTRGLRSSRGKRRNAAKQVKSDLQQSVPTGHNVPNFLVNAPYPLANSPTPGVDAGALQAYLGHRNVQHTVRYTETRARSVQGFLAGPRTQEAIGSPRRIAKAIRTAKSGSRTADRRHQMPVEDRRFPTTLTVVLILAVIFVLIVLLWPLGRLPWP